MVLFLLPFSRGDVRPQGGQRGLKQKIEKVVVGISEGEMAVESKKFSNIFKADTFDETLSSHDAQQMSIQGGMGRKKRKEMEDAFAASIMLQNYLDSIVR